MNQKIYIKPLAIPLAALFLSVFGGLWYGALFHDVQMESHGYSAEDYANNSPIWYFGGVVISLFIAWGLAMLVRLGGQSGIMGGLRASFRAAVGFGLPLVTYPLVFSPYHDFKLYAVGFSQTLIAWAIAGVIIGAMSRDRDESSS